MNDSKQGGPWLIDEPFRSWVAAQDALSEEAAEACPHKVCKFGHSADACGWCPECHPEVPEWTL